MRRLLVTFALLSAFATFAHADDGSYSVKTAMVALPDDLKESFRSLMSDQAYQVSNGNELVCTIWFRKEIPSSATADQVKNGLTYREVPQTTLIGAVKFEKQWIDFRKQDIPGGVYTMRIAIQPQDGDHEGTAPHTDFCLLIPAPKDEKPDRMEVKDLRELSGESTGSTHPGVVLLFPNHKADDTPKVVSKGKGIWVLNVKRAVKAGDVDASLGFGVVVAGNALR